MSTVLVVPTSIGAAFAFAGSSSLKHVSATRIPYAGMLHASRLLRFIRATVAHRLWLAAIALDLAGIGLQSIALHLGALAVVQPLLTLGLVFALVFRRLHDRAQVKRRQIVVGLVLAGILGVFIALTYSVSNTQQELDKTPALALASACAVLAGGCLYLARRQQRGGRAAALLGAALGIIYAGTAALLKSVTNIVLHSPWHVVVSWQFYALLLLGGFGLLLNQIAFQAGPLSASLPAATAVDPVLSIAIGVVAYDEQLPRGVQHVVLLAGLLLALCVAAGYLARTPEEPPAQAP
jgi:hypothetical protein